MKKITRKVFSVFLLTMFAVLFGCIFFVLPAWASAESIAALPAAFDPLAIVQEYAVIPVTVVCLAVGWVLKNAFPGFDNNYIPLVLLPVGIVGVLWINGWAFTPETAFAGFCSAALAVYIHSGSKHLWEAWQTKKEESKPPEP